MQKRHLLLFSLLVFLSLFLTQIDFGNSVTFIEDGINDVSRFEEGAFVGKGDYRNELDIVTLTFVGTDIILKLDANPNLTDKYHLYEVSIIWSNNTTFQNKTEIKVGSTDGSPNIDVITHTLVNATGDTLPQQPSPIYNSTIIGKNKLMWNMNVTLFAYGALSDPTFTNATARYFTVENSKSVLYIDAYLTGEEPPSNVIVFNFNTILSILGTILVTGFAGYTIGSIGVYFLTTNIRTKQTNTICMAVFVVALAILVNIWFWITPWQISWNIAVFILTILFGYFWATRGVMNLKFESPLPENIPIDTKQKLKAVIVLSKGESEDYNPLSLIRDYYIKKESGVKQVGKYGQPFELFKVKSKYRKILRALSRQSENELKVSEIGNPYRKTARKITEKLESSFLNFDFCVEAFVNDWPTINQALLTVIAKGATEITILNLFISENYHYQLVLKEMQRIDYSKIGLTIAQTDFLANNDTIQESIVNKILKAIPKKEKPANVGVILVSEGQPSEWDKKYPLTEQEDIFRKGIQKKLNSKQFSQNNIKNAWIEKREPTLQQCITELKTQKCTTMIIAAASTPIDCINTLYDIPHVIKKYVNEIDLNIITINGWNEDEEIIKEYLTLITEAKDIPLEELGKNAEITLQENKPLSSLPQAKEIEMAEDEDKKPLKKKK